MMMDDSGKGATPFRITFTGSMPQGASELQANVIANRRVPDVDEWVDPHTRPLAVVGGGPSVGVHVETLRNWPGDIWAINRTPKWLAGHGIESTLFSVDASDNPDMFSGPEYVDGAIFASWCAPAIVSRYRAQIAHMQPIVPDGFVGGTTSAGCAPIIALSMGYADVTFFGCESSFIDSDHVDFDEAEPHQMIIRAGGNDYRTTAPLLLQAEEMSKMLRTFPDSFKEESGGLLRAMFNDERWSVVGVSAALKQHLEEVNGPQGFYDAPYRRAA